MDSVTQGRSGDRDTPGLDAPVDSHRAPRTALAAVTARDTAPTRAPIAYLTNVYPHVSHSFIRREILALEQLGIPVVRFSIRRATGPLPDSGDVAEQARTAVVLDAGVAAILSAAIVAIIAHPVRFMTGLRLTLTMGRVSATGTTRHLMYLLEACWLVRTVRQRGIQHLHVHFGTNPATVARIAKAIGAIGYSMTLHGPDEFDAPVAVSLPDKIADATFVVAISQFGAAQAMRWSQRSDWPKIRVVRCGLDASFLAQDAATAPPACGTPRVFVCVARLEAQKGLSLLVEAVRQLAATGDVSLRIIGDGTLRAELSQRIADLGLGDRIALLGWRSASDIRAEITGACALVLPSFAEGLPVVLMEALALECPVIATAIAGIPELVDAACGWLIPPGSAEAIADAMRKVLLSDDDTLRAMGAAGRRRVLAHHDAAANAADLARLFEAHA